MKLMKKVYCRSCKKLVKGRERNEKGHLEIVCPKCSNVLWMQENQTWRYNTKMSGAVAKA